MRIVRIVLKENVSEEEIQHVALSQSWQLHDVILPTENNPYEKIWFAADGQTSIHYIEDFLLNVRYIAVKGEKPGQVIEQIRQLLNTYSQEEIHQMVENATEPDDLIQAIYYVGAAATSMYDADMFKMFEHMLSHSNSEVRRSAIFATAYPAWKEFCKPLEKLQASDPELTVREYANLMLTSHIKHGWNTNNR
ncbi:MAG: hypothetical protein KME22_13660 [Hassallia sp. WJT32-NPBG1]|jgi:hypothetical protein|nr:hypothetical protein [Hassallia sp. WJT32-NPBG1]